MKKKDPKYRVGGKGKPMPLKEALAKANQVHLKTGVFAAVEQVAPKPLTGRQFWDKLKELGVPVDHHESDLYIPVTPETALLVSEYEFSGNVTSFRSNVDGKTWYDIPFCYMPFWDKKGGGVAADTANKLLG